ncbi:MAG: hypothetical protein VW711_16130, partial [Verrucomicrobiales bacterium]
MVSRTMHTLVAWTLIGLIWAADSSSDRLQAAEASERYFIGVHRYRFGWPNLNDPAFYPIPDHPLSRDLYLASIEAADPEALIQRPARGMDGPRIFLPVLVKFVQTGETKWLQGIQNMFEAFHADLRKTVEEHRWFWRFEQPAALI